jgi:hypothetical protein
MAKVLDDPWDWVVAGVAYCLLFIFLNLCVVKMRRVREGDHPGIDNYLRLAVRLLVLMVAAVFAIFGFAMALGSPQAAYFMWSLSGLTLLSLPWNWTRSSSTSWRMISDMVMYRVTVRQLSRRRRSIDSPTKEFGSRAVIVLRRLARPLDSLC